MESMNIYEWLFLSIMISVFIYMLIKYPTGVGGDPFNENKKHKNDKPRRN